MQAKAGDMKEEAPKTEEKTKAKRAPRKKAEPKAEAPAEVKEAPKAEEAPKKRGRKPKGRNCRRSKGSVQDRGST